MKKKTAAKQTVPTFQLQSFGRLCFVESGLAAVRCENPAEMHLVRKIRSGKTESRPPHQEGCEGKKVLQPTQAIQISAGTSEVMWETRLVWRPELQKRADREDQSVLFFLAGANFWEKHAKNCAIMSMAHITYAIAH